MIKVNIYKGRDDRIIGFHVSGHARFARYGRDIVCAAVSVLSLNTINSIEKFTEDPFKTEQSDGDLKFKLTGPCSEQTQLLLDSYQLGIDAIAESYGGRYVKVYIRTKEV